MAPSGAIVVLRAPSSSAGAERSRDCSGRNSEAPRAPPRPALCIGTLLSDGVENRACAMRDLRKRRAPHTRRLRVLRSGSRWRRCGDASFHGRGALCSRVGGVPVLVLSGHALGASGDARMRQSAAVRDLGARLAGSAGLGGLVMSRDSCRVVPALSSERPWLVRVWSTTRVRPYAPVRKRSLRGSPRRARDR